MNDLLSVSRAVRLAGVSRAQIQDEVRNGRLLTFEGMVRLADLLLVYPGVEIQDSAEIQRAARLQEQALGKYHPEQMPETYLLAQEANRLRVQLADAQAQIAQYQGVVQKLQARLTDAQEHCSRRQKLVLQALVSWMLAQVEHRR